MNLTGTAIFDNQTVDGPASALAARFDGARMLFDETVCLDGHQTHMCLGGGDAWAPIDKASGKNLLVPVYTYLLLTEAMPGPAALATRVNCSCKGGC